MGGLRDVNPFLRKLPDPRSRTACGGLIALTLLPAILIAYAICFGQVRQTPEPYSKADRTPKRQLSEMRHPHPGPHGMAGVCMSGRPCVQSQRA